MIDVLDTLSSTLIFNTANEEERLALASRLRHWVVVDGTYLIREGDGDRNESAIFMIGEYFRFCFVNDAHVCVRDSGLMVTLAVRSHRRDTTASRI